MIKLSEISIALNVKIEGDKNYKVIAPAEPKMATEKHLAIALDKKFVDDLSKGDAKVAFLQQGMDFKSLGLKAALYASNTRYTLSNLNNIFYQLPYINKGIHSSVIIDKSCIIEENVNIGPYCVIGKGVKIKKNTNIYSNVYIGENVLIGKNSNIFSGVKISPNVSIGKNFVCHYNAVIGSDGFSFVSPEGGGVEDARKTGKIDGNKKIAYYEKIRTLGSVTIGNDVEIGANSCIDGGTISDTEIGNGTKIDNSVHIGHNVKIGNHCLLCGQVGIAGSTVIQDRVVLGGQVGVADHLIVGNDSIVAGKSGVSSNVLPNQFMMGNPAMKMSQCIDSYKALRRLPRIIKKLKN